MIDLVGLARLATEHPEDLERSVEPLRIGDRVFDTDARPMVMGIVNLSRDSAYRTSISTSTDTAIRRGRVLVAQGADIVDVGAESSNASTARVAAQAQIASLVPVIEALSGDGALVSVESYEAEVLDAGLAAGARVVNLTGSGQDDVVFDLAAKHGAAVVLCHVLGTHARDLDGGTIEGDPVPAMLEQFEERVANARARGVSAIAVDPGLGFGFSHENPMLRARLQATGLLASFRLRRLGLPICQALPHAFDVFEEEYRSAEGFFAVLAQLGRTGIYRTHEVPQVVAVLDAMARLDVSGPSGG